MCAASLNDIEKVMLLRGSFTNKTTNYLVEGLGAFGGIIVDVETNGLVLGEFSQSWICVTERKYITKYKHKLEI